MKARLRNALKHLSKGNGSGLTYGLTVMLIDNEDEAMLGNVRETLGRESLSDQEETVLAIGAITMLWPEKAGEWFRIAREQIDLEGIPDPYCYGFLFGVLDAVKWLCDNGLYTDQVSLGEVLHDFLVCDGLIGVGMYGGRSMRKWEAEINERLSDSLNGLLEAVKKDPALLDDLQYFLEACASIRNKNGEISDVAEWFVEKFQFKVFNAMDIELRSAVLSQPVRNLGEPQKVVEGSNEHTEG